MCLISYVVRHKRKKILQLEVSKVIEIMQSSVLWSASDYTSYHNTCKILCKYILQRYLLDCHKISILHIQTLVYPSICSFTNLITQKLEMKWASFISSLLPCRDKPCYYSKTNSSISLIIWLMRAWQIYWYSHIFHSVSWTFDGTGPQ